MVMVPLLIKTVDDKILYQTEYWSYGDGEGTWVGWVGAGEGGGQTLTTYYKESLNFLIKVKLGLRHRCFTSISFLLTVNISKDSLRYSFTSHYHDITDYLLLGLLQIFMSRALDWVFFSFLFFFLPCSVLRSYVFNTCFLLRSTSRLMSHAKRYHMPVQSVY